MLQTLSDCYEISFNPMNTSKSKQLYSIPRGQRFQESKITCDKFYNLPEIKNTRAASIGYGSKTDFSKFAAKTPAAIYDYKTIFDKKHGYSFRNNREQVKCGSIVYGNRNPSPNQYKTDKSYLSNISYTIRSITPKMGNIKLNANYILKDKYTSRFSPGPGRYEDQLKLNDSGKYFYSRYKDTKHGGLINPEQRKSLTRLTPGKINIIDWIIHFIQLFKIIN